MADATDPPGSAPASATLADLTAQRDALLTAAQSASNQLNYEASHYAAGDTGGISPAQWGDRASYLQSQIVGYANALNDIGKKITAAAADAFGATAGASAAAFTPAFNPISVGVSAPAQVGVAASAGQSLLQILTSPLVLAGLAFAAYWFFIRGRSKK